MTGEPERRVVSQGRPPLKRQGNLLVPVAVRIFADQREELRRAGVREGRSLSEVVREALDLWIGRKVGGGKRGDAGK